MSKPQIPNSGPPLQLLKDFVKNIGEQLYSYTVLYGGTQNQVFLVNKKYTFKSSTPQKIKAEFVYNTYYNAMPYAQKLVFCDKKYQYIAYKYIQGDDNGEVNKKIVKQVLKYINNYKTIFQPGYGDLNAPQNSWYNFIINMFNESKPYIKHLLKKEEINEIYKALTPLDNYEFEKKLLHGDLRQGNIITENGQLTGIIDPFPMIGDALYDKVFYIISMPETLQFFKLKKLYKKLKAKKEIVKALILIISTVSLKRLVKYDGENQKIEYFLYLIKTALNEM